MTVAADADPNLESLLDELRAVTAELNQLHHPVYPADPRRVAEVESRLVELRVAITVRRRELR